MNKFLAVLKREYLQAVRKKMFIIMTILLPFLMAAVAVLPSLLMTKGLGQKQVVVLDGTGKLKDAFEHPEQHDSPHAPAGMRERANEMPLPMNVTYLPFTGSPDAALQPYKERLGAERKEDRLDGVFIVPAAAFQSAADHMKYYSRSSTDFITQQRLAGTANRAIQRQRLASKGLAPAEIETVLTDTPVDAVQVSKSGAQKAGGIANLFIGLTFAMLLMIPSLIYGLEIMRGIIQEKNDRVVEVLVSSMSPQQLLSGKIAGVALVGLTQISVWLLMMVSVATFGAVTLANAGIDATQYLHASTFIYFIIFFILAYLGYVCIYAIGGASCNSDKEAQQLIAPISMVMMLPWVMIGPLITNPDSPMIVAVSMAPVWGPLVMFVRTLVSDPPLTQVLVTVLVSSATVAAFLWATAKIFRVGILSYGKRPTIPELWRWVKVS